MIEVGSIFAFETWKRIPIKLFGKKIISTEQGWACTVYRFMGKSYVVGVEDSDKQKESEQ